jgi:hypothetical protein
MSDKKKDGLLKQTFVTRTMGYLDVFQKRELWKKVSEEFNGTFKISHNSGNELEILRIFIPYKKWEIKLSESDTRPFKFEIEFKSEKNYELIIGFEDAIDKLLKRLGKREVEIANDKFDNRYLIKSHDPVLTKKLFTQEIIDCLLKYNVYSLAYSSDLKKQASNLITVISRTVDDKSTMEDLIKLQMRLIDKFEELMLIK